MLAPGQENATLESLADEWRELAATSGRGIFQTWEWADAWWRAFGDGRRLALRACRDHDGRLVAVVPLYVARAKGLVLARFLGHGPGDELGPVHVPEHRETAAAALRLAIDELGCDVLLAEQLPGDERWPDLLGVPRWRLEANPALSVPEGGWQAYLEGRSANLRQELKRRSRTLSRAGSVGFRLATETTLERDLDALFALHLARWRGRRTDFADTPFHRDIARRALENGWLRLWILELDARPVAAWHGFQVGTVASYYQAGRDPALDRYGVGTVLLAHSIREALTEGATEYRFGRGAEPFKYRFADQDDGLETVVLARTSRGRAALGVARSVRPLVGLARLIRRG